MQQGQVSEPARQPLARAEGATIGMPRIGM
jgi:hypothetical protein